MQWQSNKNVTLSDPADLSQQPQRAIAPTSYKSDVKRVVIRLAVAVFQNKESHALGI
jgi:hypothetical protein